MIRPFVAGRIALLCMCGVALALPAQSLEPSASMATPESLYMGGEITLAGGTLLFSECRTGRTYAVVHGAEAQRLEEEYRTRLRGQPGALYVSFDGTPQSAIATMPDGSVRQSVVVDRFVGVWASQTCERSRADAALANTYWRIVHLAGAPIATVDGRREPHLLLRQEDANLGFAATVGCNQYKGRWRYGARTIGFERGAATQMACPASLAAPERQLQQLLDTAAQWRRAGNTMVLEDVHGTALALLEAVYF
jgi:copper homeostasis protein (lipoprotein)